MFEPGISALQASAGALVTLIVILIVTGRLVWHKQLEDVREDAEKRVAQANAETTRWRSAYEYSEEARRIDAQHAEHLLDLGYASNRIISALPLAPKEDPDADASVAKE